MNVFKMENSKHSSIQLPVDIVKDIEDSFALFDRD